jgi:hypothetical protein
MLKLAVAFTQHFGLEGSYNEVHPSIQYQYDHFIAGAYYNSEGNTSAYAGGRYDFDSLYIELGFVTGYEGIALAPYGRVGYEFNDTFSVFVAPAYELPDRLGMVIGTEFVITSW